jgi:hypothetical protein
LIALETRESSMVDSNEICQVLMLFDVIIKQPDKEMVAGNRYF